MDILTWNPKIATGIRIIDGQHQQIVAYIGELDLATQLEDRDKISEILDGLLDYTASHFAYEEDLMHQAGYPLEESHRQTHEAFIQTINQYVRSHRAGEDIGRELLEELQGWLEEHIQDQDIGYAGCAKTFLSENGPHRNLLDKLLVHLH